MSQVVHSFTVNRSTWIRGDGAHSRLLRKSDKRRCCLGFYLSSCGIPDANLMNERTAASLRLKEGHDGDDLKTLGLLDKLEWLYAGVGADSAEAMRLMDINDRQFADRDEAMREMKIKVAFAKQNIAVHFIG